MYLYKSSSRLPAVCGNVGILEKNRAAYGRGKHSWFAAGAIAPSSLASTGGLIVPEPAVARPLRGARRRHVRGPKAAVPPTNAHSVGMRGGAAGRFKDDSDVCDLALSLARTCKRACK